MNKGRLFIVSGPSGSGKDTILREVLGNHPEIAFSISFTSRPIRSGEIDGQKYNFISSAHFLELIENDMLLEYNNFCGNYYGSPKAPVMEWLSQGRDVILEVDVNGASQIRKHLPEAVSIFIMPSSYSELSRRLAGRNTESPEVINERLAAAVKEIERATEYDYIVVNDKLSEAVENMTSVILSGRLTLEKQKHIIEEVLSDVKSGNR